VSVQEIVGAIIDSEQVTSDLETIGRSIAAGRHVEYVSRKRAKTVASFDQDQPVARLAVAPTLFIMEDGTRFVKHDPAPLP
jgi:hypothetical protein